ncbi:MAG: FecR domain-containing protein [Bryobacterales bacterium]|nr:FecR domain-containing protein [Bryobacterales bacterium]
MIRAGRRRCGAWIAAVVLFGLNAAGQVVPDPGAARVVSLSGTLTVKRFRQEARVLRLNESIQPGDELATGENSHATIRTTDGGTVTVYPDSRLIFNERSADLRELLHLFLGSIKVHIEKISGRPNPHKLTTPTAVIAVRGTTFSVFVDDTDATLVAVDEGEVGVVNAQLPDQEVTLRAGQRTWVRLGQPPQQARAFRGRSERADLAQGRRPSGMGMGDGKSGMAAEMRRARTMSGSQDMGSMSGRTNPVH